MATSTDKDISYADLKDLLGRSNSLLLVDVRTKEEVDKGRILGSVHIPVCSPHIVVMTRPYTVAAFKRFVCVAMSTSCVIQLESLPIYFRPGVFTVQATDPLAVRNMAHGPLITFDTVESAFALDPAEFQAKYGVSKPPLDAPELVFHCQMGRRGGQATDTAHKLGYRCARNYAGGYKEWSEKEQK